MLVHVTGSSYSESDPKPAILNVQRQAQGQEGATLGDRTGLAGV